MLLLCQLHLSQFMTIPSLLIWNNMTFAVGTVLLNKQTEHKALQRESVLHKLCVVRHILCTSVEYYLTKVATETLVISNV
jgi:hypothetical protein